MTTRSRAERLSGGLLGLLVGDALGVPYEFHEPNALPRADRLEYQPPAGFARAHRGVPPGTWSDDGALALCLLASLLERGRFDADDFGQRMVDWFRRGYMAVDGRVYDVGGTTARALEAIERGVPPLEAGSPEESALGNGSLMRALPLVLWHRGPDAELVELASAQSCLTHRHPRALVCCALYCLWARRTLDGADDAWGQAVSALRAILPSGSIQAVELERHVRPDAPVTVSGTGYVVDCLRSARWAVEQGDYGQAVRAAIGLGHDTDTTACVAGGIAGLRDGLAAVPERWRAALRGTELYEPLLAQLS